MQSRAYMPNRRLYYRVRNNVTNFQRVSPSFMESSYYVYEIILGQPMLLNEKHTVEINVAPWSETENAKHTLRLDLQPLIPGFPGTITKRSMYYGRADKTV